MLLPLSQAQRGSWLLGTRLEVKWVGARGWVALGFWAVRVAGSVRRMHLSGSTPSLLRPSQGAPARQGWEGPHRPCASVLCLPFRSPRPPGPV